MCLNSRCCKSLLAILCVGLAFTKISFAQTCIDDDGDGWGWDPEANSTCQVAGGDTPDLINVGGIKVSWSESSASENVSEYEIQGQINDGAKTRYYRGSASEFSVRLSSISATYNDTVCVRVRAIRITTIGNTTRQTNSEWSNRSCIIIPDAPLQPPQIIELSLTE